MGLGGGAIALLLALVHVVWEESDWGLVLLEEEVERGMGTGVGERGMGMGMGKGNKRSGGLCRGLETRMRERGRGARL